MVKKPGMTRLILNLWTLKTLGIGRKRLNGETSFCLP
jgi:hypothetical protein